MKRYFKVTAVSPSSDQKVTHLRVDFTYSKGGINIWTYKTEPRGYYVLITPVERSGIMESFTAFTGKKYIIREVTRASARAEQEAKAECDSFIADSLANIAHQLGYELGEEER